MSGKRRFRIWGWQGAMGMAISFLLLGQGVLGQQFSSRDRLGTENCLRATRVNDPEGKGTACDRQDVEELARTGHAFAENQLGIESALVLGPQKTIDDARKWFEKAARQGYAPAQVNLAVLYLNGWGVEKDYGTALYWLKVAAEQGNARAHTNLGILYMNGWGVRKDLAEAASHFQFAAERGETGAMVDLGFLIEGGPATVQNKVQAARWYRLAAERGDALGQNNLADLYLRGEGVERNDVLAREWFEKAAAQGNTGARIKLGYMYATNRAGRKDAEQAYALIWAAELAGDARGEEYLAPLEKQLNAQQIERAKQSAKAMLASEEHAKLELAFLR
jgi:uncharacterized protein